MIRICFVKLARNILSQTKVVWEGKNIYTALINRRIANIFLKGYFQKISVCTRYLCQITHAATGYLFPIIF